MKKWIIPIFILGLVSGVLVFNSAFAQSEKVQIDFFYSATCPFCAQEKVFLKNLQERYSDIQINQYEVIQSSENQAKLKDFYEKYNVPEQEQGYVPVTFTSLKYFIGFNESIGGEIESCLKTCLAGGQASAQKFKVPLLGEIDPKNISLPLLTAVLGTLDGFNPCAMWILIVLISLMLATKSRKKIALVGGTFIFAEGLLYFLFMPLG